MNVRVQLFARARDLAGTAAIDVPVDEPVTVAALRTSLSSLCPALQPLMPRLHVAINNEYAAETDSIPAGAEVACFPPVSGG